MKRITLCCPACGHSEDVPPAALYKRSTKVWYDAVAAGGAGLRVLGLEGAVPIEGGLPLVVDGKLVGAIGLSGGSGAQDGQCAQAGADSVK